MEIAKALSAILFYQAEPMTLNRLSSTLKCSLTDISEAISTLSASLESTGLCVIQNCDEVTLGTRKEMSELIESITKEELSKDLSKAALETLAVVLYKGPVTRSEIDYVRGVNSTFILRNLLIRGLVEKIDNRDDQRSFKYKPTFLLLENMGISNIVELPEYSETMQQLGSFLADKQEEDHDKVSNVNHSEDDSEIEADVIEHDSVGASYDDEPFEDRLSSNQNV